MADGEVLELTQDELNDRIREEAERILAADREKREAEDQRRDLELSTARKALRAAAVERKLIELEGQGHAPTVLRKAAELMLADVDETPAVTLMLSQDDGQGNTTETEKKMSVTEVVLDLLAAMPATALTKDQPRISSVLLSKDAELDVQDKRTPQEKADAALAELHDGTAIRVGSLSM